MSAEEIWADVVLAATVQSGCLAHTCHVDVVLHPDSEQAPTWYGELTHTDDEPAANDCGPKIISIESFQRRKRSAIVVEIARWLELHHRNAA